MSSVLTCTVCNNDRPVSSFNGCFRAKYVEFKVCGCCAFHSIPDIAAVTGMLKAGGGSLKDLPRETWKPMPDSLAGAYLKGKLKGQPKKYKARK